MAGRRFWQMEVELVRQALLNLRTGGIQIGKLRLECLSHFVIRFYDARRIIDAFASTQEAQQLQIIIIYLLGILFAKRKLLFYRLSWAAHCQSS